jgi:glycosyltransferase involved in cell wall biosynthesis
MAKGVCMNKRRPLRVAMIAYAHYFTDARIKNYVDALLDVGAHVDVFALGKEIGIYREGNLCIHSLDTKYQGESTILYVFLQAKFLLLAFWHLLLRSFVTRYDIVHAHNMPNILALAGVPLKIFGTKVILDVHDTMPEAYATKFGYDLDSVPVKILIAEQSLSAACADKVIATNIMHKEVLHAHGIREEKIDLIFNVGNRKIFSARSPSDKPKPVPVNGQELWLGYHGTVAKRLGIMLIVDALSLLKENCPGVRFLCVGEGDDLEAMKQRAAERQVTHMIRWLPFVDVEKLPAVLQPVHVGVIGNQRETEVKRNYMLPVKMLEYAAMEIPTIIPRLKILERYFDETSAFFYEPDDAQALAGVITSIYNNRNLIATRIDGLRKFNAEYNWEIMAKRYLNIVDELTA